MAALTDDRMTLGLKDPTKIRWAESSANSAIAFIKAVTVKNSLQGLSQAGELLSENDLSEAVTARNLTKLVTNFVSGATNPRILRDVSNIGRGVVGGGEYVLKDTRGFTAAAISLLPANELYGSELGQQDMLNVMGRPVTNFWYAPATKRILPTSAGSSVDPVITPLVSAGLFISPIKPGQMSLATYKDNSDDIDIEGGLLSSFDEVVQADAVRLFGNIMRSWMTPELIQDLTELASQGKAGQEAAQERLNKISSNARAVVKDTIQARVMSRDIVPHWQEK
jgi:hypothetical protein